MTHGFRTLICTTALTLVMSACQPQSGSQISPHAQNTEQSQPMTLSDRELNLRQMAASALQTGDTSAAAEFYRQMAEVSQGSVEGHLKGADLYRSMGEHTKAVRLLRAAQQQAPDNKEASLALGHALTKIGEVENALAAFDRILTKEPNNTQALSGKAVAYDYQGQHLQAQELYRKILALNPGNVAARNNMALSSTLDGNYAQAIEILEPLSRGSGSTPMIRQNLALAYGMSGQNDKALALLKQDMPEEKARQNLAFYNHYRGKKIPTPQHSASALPSPTVKAAPVVAISQDDSPPKSAEILSTSEVVLEDASESTPEAQTAKPSVAEEKPEQKPAVTKVEEKPVIKPQPLQAKTKEDTPEKATVETSTTTVTGTNLNTAPIEDPPEKKPFFLEFTKLKPAANSPVPKETIAEEIAHPEADRKSEGSLDSDVQAQIDAGLIKTPNMTPSKPVEDKSADEEIVVEKEVQAKPAHPFPFSSKPEYSYPTTR